MGPNHYWKEEAAEEAQMGGGQIKEYRSLSYTCEHNDEDLIMITRVLSIVRFVIAVRRNG